MGAGFVSGIGILIFDGGLELGCGQGLQSLAPRKVAKLGAMGWLVFFRFRLGAQNKSGRVSYVFLSVSSGVFCVCIFTFCKVVLLVSLVEPKAGFPSLFLPRVP